jgi:hypothetical protein
MSIFLDLTDTNCDDIIFKQRVQQKAECNMGSIAESLAEASMAMSKEQMAGLPVGMNVDSSLMERTSVIKQYLEQQCQGDAAIRGNFRLALRGAGLSCKQLQGIQDADQTTQCIINAAIQAVTKDEAKGNVKQTADLLGPLGNAISALFKGPLMIMAGIILGIGFLIVILRLGRGRVARADAEGNPSLLPSELTQVKGAVDKVAKAATGGGANMKDTLASASSLIESATPVAKQALAAGKSLFKMKKE